MIIFHTLLTEKSGFGNFIRMKEIYRELKNFAKDIYFLVMIDDENNFSFGSKDTYIFFNQNDISNKFKTLLERKPSKVLLVSDFPFIDDVTKHIYSSYTFDYTISLNDATLQEVEPNIFINTDKLIRPKSSVKSFVGLKYQIIRSDLSRGTYLNKQEVKKIGVMFGGSDPDNLTSTFLKDILRKELNKSYFFKIVVNNKNRYNKFLKIINELCILNIEILLAPNMPEFYKDIDVLINMGGMSSYEAMYCGVNVCSVEWNYMGEYVRSLALENLLINLGSIDQACDFLNLILGDLENLNKIRNQALKVLDGKATQRIAQIILETYGDMK
ncbi:hypothetical protein [Lysinibacillus sp. NPDC059133]|uniref:hypothetical protein n=1 Tax=Lysinibacillus sp. NPDC059133 TaxID=3346737 RepID=UPI0036AA6E8D